ncbi:hypothetical protein LTR15_007752 [Elasticomyces elasticus]|nr:hypothetical protein LTR15_007752 [Elasticomyces elasticus]
MTFKTAMQRQTCFLLTTLPAELRIDIWKLAFSGTDRVVDLLQPPQVTIHLLLTCQQVHNEAREFFARPREEYWRSTDFMIESRLFGGSMDHVNPQGVTYVRHLSCRVPRYRLRCENMWPSMGFNDWGLLEPMLNQRKKSIIEDFIFQRQANGTWKCDLPSFNVQGMVQSQIFIGTILIPGIRSYTIFCETSNLWVQGTWDQVGHRKVTMRELSIMCNPYHE